ncbi:MAG: TonB-dependent receptor [Flavobacteriales bacterium]
MKQLMQSIFQLQKKTLPMAMLTLLMASAWCANGQYTISGVVLKSDGLKPMRGAHIELEGINLSTTTDVEGLWQLGPVAAGTHTLKCTKRGYADRTETLVIDGDITNLELVLHEETNVHQYYHEPLPITQTGPEVNIDATRAGKQTPLAYTNLRKPDSDISKLNIGQDMPYLLRMTPSLVATSDAGNGVGYTGLWIRGSDPSRVNVSINGVPLNDPESQQVFWVNTPDLSSSADNIQVQRGVGTSTNGAGAFGGSIKIDTRAVRNMPFAELSTSLGSFNTQKHTLSFGTGLFRERFTLEGRISNISSDGYIDRASSKLGAFFIEGNYTGSNTLVKVVAFGGRERTYQSWNGSPWEVLYGTDAQKLNFAQRNYLNQAETNNLLNSGRTYNYYEYENQVDNYGQDHLQLHLTRFLTRRIKLNLTGHYTHGQGYFEEYKYNNNYSDYGLQNVVSGQDTVTATDLVRRRWLKNDFYGVVFSALRNGNIWESVAGGAYNEYHGHHFGELTWLQFAGPYQQGLEYYRGSSRKRDANVYWKNTVSVIDGVDLFADLQLRAVQYSTSGTDNDLKQYDVEDRLIFFNPKAGVNVRLTKTQRAYISVAKAGKEPNRNDYVDATDYKLVKPESMLDIEAGYQYARQHWAGWLNLYHMHYKNQLVLTGELNDVGAPLRANAPRSYRMGVELGGEANFFKHIRLQGNVTVSRNKIDRFDQVLYDYTNGYYVIQIEHRGKDISFSPAITGAAQLAYGTMQKPTGRTAWEVAALAKYVGKQYMDNTQSETTALDAYLVTDLRATCQYTHQKWGRLQAMFTINNVLGSLYVSNGYTYSYIYGSRITERFYYPQAPRTFTVSLGAEF